MRRLLLSMIVAALTMPPTVLAQEKREAPKEAPHYESPILSLLLLPVNLLIRMASVLEPEKAETGERTPAR
ncbi:MAG: hypothetical protein ACREQ9_22520 [Candidatus Binatia bacterium]